MRTEIKFADKSYRNNECVHYNHNMLADNFYNDKFVGYLASEFLDVENGIYRFITDEKGNKPFAIRTLDSQDNDMIEGSVSVIPLKDKYKGITIIKKSNDDYNITIVEFETNGVVIDIKKVQEFTYNILNPMGFTIEGFTEDINDVIEHAITTGIAKINVKDKNYLYTVDKYAYNPMRRIMTKLFVNVNGSLCSTGKDIGIMEISNNTPDKWKAKGKVHSNGIYRVYYYTRHDSSYKFVRGVRLDYVKVSDLTNDIDIYSSMYEKLSVFKLNNNEEVVGAVMGKKYILLYKMNGRIQSLTLDYADHKHIKSIREI